MKVGPQLRRRLRRYGGLTRRCPYCNRLALAYVTGPTEAAELTCRNCGWVVVCSIDAEPAVARAAARRGEGS